MRAGPAAILAVAIAACQPHVPLGDDAAVTETEACLDAAGGTMRIAGATLEVPPDALAVETCLVLRHFPLDTIPLGYDLRSRIIEVDGVDGPFDMRRPFTLTLAYVGSAAEAYPARYEDGEWERPGDEVLEQVLVGAAEANIQTFFGGIVAVMAIADAECRSDADCIIADEFCTEAFYCAAVECDVDADCESGGLCSDGACNDPCATNADCNGFAGLCLDDGSCGFITCFDGEDDCPEGEFCYVDDDDQEPLGEGGEGVCIPEDWD